MSLIQVENLTFCYPSGLTPVFQNVSLQLDTDWKLGLIGRNGRGKTTFLKLLLGRYEYTGRIVSSVCFEYFPYSVTGPERETAEVLSGVCPAAQEWELIRELSQLGVDAAVMYRPFRKLSNGEQTKVLLAALFLREGNFLLIDEPTNHLDLEARRLVSAYLQRKKGFILVSHDRSFLDGCVDHILSINRANIEVQSGNYSTWEENFARRQSYEEAQNARLQKDIARLQEAAGRAAGWSDRVEASKKGSDNSGLKVDRGYIGHKSAKMMKRVKCIEGRRQRAADEKSALLKNTETAEMLKLFPLQYHSERLFSLSEVSVCYGESELNPVSLEICRGERIALDGRNGSGKTSLLRLIAGEALTYKGTFFRGSGVAVSYVAQDAAFLRGDLSRFIQERGLDESLFKAILRKMNFERAQFLQDLSAFSGGQKKKVLLAASLCERAHLYVWDEPLNYIDLDSRIQLEELILRNGPTMIFVEHDQAFRRRIATRTIRLHPHYAR